MDEIYSYVSQKKLVLYLDCGW